MTSLPPGWRCVRLEDVAEVRLGRQRSPKNHTGDNMRPYIRAANVTWSGLDLSDVKTMQFTDSEVETYRLLPNDIVMSEASGSAGEVGKPALWTGEIESCCFQNTLIRIRVSEDVDPKFMFYVLKLEALLATWSKGIARGVGIHHLGATRLAKWKFALPPIAEQRRVTTELERRLSHLEAAAESVRTARRKMATLRSAVVRAGASGRLASSTDEDSLETLCRQAKVPFETHPERPAWVVVRLGDIADIGSGTTPKRSETRYWIAGDIPWVTSGQATKGIVREASAWVTAVALQETSLKLWPAGTLLMAMYGEGKTRGHVTELAIDATCNQACAAIRLRDAFRSMQPFVLLALNAQYETMRRLGGGGVQENLNLGLVRDIQIPLPPAKEQLAIVAEVDRRLSLLEAATNRTEAAERSAERLHRSLLARAVAGRLLSGHAHQRTERPLPSKQRKVSA